MTLGSFIVRNAMRNRRRFILTLLSVTFSLFLLTVLLVMLRGLTEPATTDEAALRIVVRHKVSLANMLFSKYKERIERMPGVKHCTKLLWFGGIYRDEANFSRNSLATLTRCSRYSRKRRSIRCTWRRLSGNGRRAW